MEQRTIEWFEARRGNFSASQIYRLMGKKGLGETGNTYILEKVTEALGVQLNEVSTWQMQYGTDTEPMAKEYYQAAFKCKVYDAGFLVPDFCNECGASPDGIVHDENKAIEIKCPANPVNHTKNLLIKSDDDLKILHAQYYWQVQMVMLVTDTTSCDFISFHPEFTGMNRMICVNIKRNNEDIELMKQRILEAVKIKHEYLKQINL